ncbi:MAG: LamG-like jellyroll fold domain-containing protein, partial [Chloroflexota bacterium]|nr:LamG-like jellyroll fold domain-containing protein [Chloroflexota bacterium]
MANTATSMYFNSANDDPDYAEYSEAKGQATSSGPRSLRFGYGDWTAECWAYMTAVDGSGFGSFLAFDGVGSEWFTLGYNNASGSTGTRVYLTAGDGTSYNRSDVITGSQLNAWHHHAAGRVGDLWVHWYDGVIIDSVSVAGEYFNFNQFRIGTNGGNYYHAHGYVDQVRVSSIARYGTIEIPSEYHKNWQAAGHGKNAILPENVALLVRSRDATDGSSTFTDDSPYGCPITTTGVTHENTTTVPQLSGNTAIYHDGSPNSNRIYVDAGFTHPKLETAVGDGSIDFWYKNLGTTQTNACVFEIPPYSGATSGVLFQWQSDDLVDVYCGASPALCMEIDMDHAGDWHHYALSKEAKVVTVWKDGSILKCNAASTWTSFAWNGTSDIVIGGAAHNTIYADYSYMDDFRVCHGQSAYSVGFVPYGGQKNVAANRGGVVIDARHPSANSHSINMGRPAIGSDYATNANNYCMNFNGTNQYLHKITKNWRSADDRGTIFAWIYKDDDSGTQDFFTTSDTDTNAHAFIFGIKSTGKMYLQQRASDTDQVMTSTGPSVATGGWHSIALTSDGDDYKFYYDGAASTFTATSGTDDGDWISSVSNRDNVVIGCWLRTSAVDIYDGKAMQVAYWGGSSGTTG